MRISIKEANSKIFTMIYATHSLNGELEPDEIKFLRYFESRCNLIVTINIDIAKINNVDLNSFSRMIVRENIGFDLGAYRDTLRILSTSEFEIRNLCVLNSSCIWNPHKLNEIISELMRAEKRVYGMTDNFSGGYHIQSYFFWVPDDFISDFVDIFSSDAIRNVKWKRAAVAQEERKITKALQQCDISIDVLFPSEKGKLERFSSRNPAREDTERFVKNNAPFEKRIK